MVGVGKSAVTWVIGERFPLFSRLACGESIECWEADVKKSGREKRKFGKKNWVLEKIVILCCMKIVRGSLTGFQNVGFGAIKAVAKLYQRGPVQYSYLKPKR